MTAGGTRGRDSRVLGGMIAGEIGLIGQHQNNRSEKSNEGAKDVIMAITWPSQMILASLKRPRTRPMGESSHSPPAPCHQAPSQHGQGKVGVVEELQVWARMGLCGMMGA